MYSYPHHLYPLLIQDIQEADTSRFESSKIRGEAGLLIDERLTRWVKDAI